MSLILLALTVVSLFAFSASSSPHIDLNPELGKYQNLDECFPLRETWITLYRNYPWDPVFGGDATCIRESGTGPGVNGTYPILSQFGNVSVKATATFEASNGYTYAGHNILKLTPEGGTDSIKIYIAYADCEKCGILRKTYATDNACALLIPESQLGKNSTCCDFIFDLLCGSTPKYYMWNDNCRA
ncbi:hypothetical protein ISCGN_011490 [Ixodes scapularis]|uniref:Lipocal-1 1 n=1 Tax=Ixodes scapularis TaxID=6945 RepID=B7QIW6_IXOSC|nr:conserved hypothetical protein [Ixodes scapularis]|eukprot:XP_002415123.1 conserved hypothetical protein [Ixodes scapularis]